MANSNAAEAKRKLTDSEREAFLRIKERLTGLQIEDMKLRAELDSMGLKFERKWWHGPLGKPLNFEI